MRPSKPYWNAAVFEKKRRPFACSTKEPSNATGRPLSTVELLAQYKPAGMKIELFYFLPNSWLDRSLHASKDEAKVIAWWGRQDWRELKGMRPLERAQKFCERFTELGYRDVKPWPIYESQDSQRTMYYMIHATDHNEAPMLMRRAYARAVEPREEPEQFLIDFGSASNE